MNANLLKIYDFVPPQTRSCQDFPCHSGLCILFHLNSVLVCTVELPSDCFLHFTMAKFFAMAYFSIYFVHLLKLASYGIASLSPFLLPTYKLFYLPF